MTDGPVVVTGATGNQGGAVARALLDGGRPVRALVRDPDKPAAQELAAAGAELAQGDMEDRDSLDRALAGAAGLFGVQNFWEAGAEGEVRQGKLLGDAAAAAGVGHTVYSSVGGADRDSGVSHFDTKWQIEEHLRSLDIRLTVLRPVFLMENFNSPIYRGGLANGVLPMALSSDREFQLIACADIGVYAAKAFADPGEWAGRGLEIAGEELTPGQAAALFAAALDREIGHVKPPGDVLRNINPEVAEMFEWYERAGYEADLDALAQIHPGPVQLRDWIASSWDGPAG